MKIKNRHRLKSKEVRKMLGELQSIFSCDFFDNKASVETGDVEGAKMILIDNHPYFMCQKERIFFSGEGSSRIFPAKKDYV